MTEANPQKLSDAYHRARRSLGLYSALLLACLHRVAHHDDDLRLIWIDDIHLIAQRMSADEWRLFEQAAADRRVHAVCAKGISLARHYFHTALPHAMSPELDSRGGPDAHNSEAATAAFLDGRSRRIDILRSDLRALSRWGDRVRLLKEHAFPSAAYMRSKYAVSHRAWLPLLYGRRIVAGGWRWLRRVE